MSSYFPGVILSLFSLAGLQMEVDDEVTTKRNISKLKAELTKGKWNAIYGKSKIACKRKKAVRSH